MHCDHSRLGGRGEESVTCRGEGGKGEKEWKMKKKWKKNEKKWKKKTHEFFNIIRVRFPT